MKRRYVFLRNHSQLKPGDFIYSVWIGESLREQSKKTLVEEYCKDVGLYFKPYSIEVCSALDMAREQFKVDGNRLANPFRSASLNISEFYKMLIDDSFTSFESDHEMSETEKWIEFRNTNEYAIQKNKLSCNTKCQPSIRKNLSLAECNEGYKAAIGLLALLGLFLVDMMVSNIINWLFSGSF